MPNDRRELYRSSNGDAWFLGRDPSNASAVVIHEANRPSGGQINVIDLSAFLNAGNGPEQQALLVAGLGFTLGGWTTAATAQKNVEEAMSSRHQSIQLFQRPA